MWKGEEIKHRIQYPNLVINILKHNINNTISKLKIFFGTHYNVWSIDFKVYFNLNLLFLHNYN